MKKQQDLTGNRNKKKNPLESRDTPLMKFFKSLPGLAGLVLRWGVAVLLVSLAVGTVSSYHESQDVARELASELSDLERQHEELQVQVTNFADPEWRENYWKWRTMRHEPGEYYIDFVRQGIL